MRLAILQLSDIHITGPEDAVLGRAKEIAGAIRGLPETTDACLVALTGDIAHSGSSIEYGLAATFINLLTAQISEIVPAPHVGVVAIPGNHDCSFQAASDVRPVLLQSLPHQVQSLQAGSDLIAHCLAVQSAFL